MDSGHEVTRLLGELSQGKEGASEALFALVYEELHSVARRCMRREPAGHTLQTTALVHEAYLRLGGDPNASWESRAQFLRVAAGAMRRVLVDSARRRRSEKRGGARDRVPLDAAGPAADEAATVDVVALDDALKELAEIDPRMSQIVELRFFGGFTVDEAAKVMGISPRTLKSDWQVARIWLKEQLEEGGEVREPDE